MATLSIAGLRHGLWNPLRVLRRRTTSSVADATQRSGGDTPLFGNGAQSVERHERIATYARCGYFHMSHASGMFVAPLDIPPE